VTEKANEGTDHVISSISFTLSAHVENLTLTGTDHLYGWGNDRDNSLLGNAGDNKLVGHDGNDRLNGALGRDILEGGAGNDTYVLGSTSLPPPSPFVLNVFAYDTVVEAADGGIDTIEVARDRRSFIVDFTGYTLGAFIENGRVIGTGDFNLTGNALSNGLTGNDGVNVLDGAEGADTLSGGFGKDTLVGGAGNDTYYLSDTNFEPSLDGESFDYVFDIVVEAANGGIDTMIFHESGQSKSFGLAENVENGTISAGSAGDIYGNGLANDLTGSRQGNRLDGGLGPDIMRGGLGDDVYEVNEAGDRVIEAANAGRDIIWSRVTYVLPKHVESLVVLSQANVRGTGNALDNIIAGSIGSNRLSGLDGDDTLRGWEGDDTLIGGAGDDTLFGGTGADRVIGGLGWDKLTGDAGAVIFDFNSIRDSVVGAKRDVVNFLRAEGDKIDFSTIDSDTDGTAGNQTFKWIGSAGFSGLDGQLRFANGILAGDVNGDRKADFEIKIVGTLTAADIIL
jgi:Ca2+-binding RTX toxin-like protein